MGLLDGVKGLLVDLKIDNISGNQINLIKFESVDNRKFGIYLDRKKLVFRNSHLANQEQKEVVETLVRERFGAGEEIIEEAAEEKISGYQTMLTGGEYDDILDYFEGRLNYEETSLLHSSAYLSKLFYDPMVERKKVGEVKHQIYLRYGTHGANVANLLTAGDSGGYFRTHILPLLKALDDEGRMENDELLRIYIGLVDDFPSVVFVGREDSGDQIKDLILSKVDRLKKYRQGLLNIHGIGDRNILVIESVVSGLESQIGLIKKEVNRKQQVIHVRLIFET